MQKNIIGDELMVISLYRRINRIRSSLFRWEIGWNLYIYKHISIAAIKLSAFEILEMNEKRLNPATEMTRNELINSRV